MKRLFVNFMTFAVMATTLHVAVIVTETVMVTEMVETTVGPVALLLWAKISCPAR